MTILIIILLLVYFLNNTFVFRFQRTTLSISRAMVGLGNSNIQALLSPTWLGLLGWANTILCIVISVSLFLELGWFYLSIFLIYVFVGTALIDVITPIPSYNRCFEIIENSLSKDIKKALDVDEKLLLLKLLNKIREIKKNIK